MGGQAPGQQNEGYDDKADERTDNEDQRERETVFMSPEIFDERGDSPQPAGGRRQHREG